MTEEKWKISVKKEEDFNCTVQLDPIDFFLIDISNEDETEGGGWVVNLSTLIHMLKHVGIAGADPKRWT